VRRWRKRLARSVVVPADQAPTSAGHEPKTPRDNKTNYVTAFFDSIGQTRNWRASASWTAFHPVADLSFDGCHGSQGPCAVIRRLVGDGEECPRQFNPERLGRLQIDDELELVPMRGSMVSTPSGPHRSRPCSRAAMSSTLRTTTNPGCDKAARAGQALTGVARSIRIASCRSPAERCGQRGYFVGAGS
jgi:hypothetical protein